MVNEETVYFIFQVEFDVQLQRSLNFEAYETAKEVRQKRQRVDEALARLQQRKTQTGGPSAAVSGTTSGEALLSLDELASEGLRLRTEMAKAVAEERYTDAARFRDALAQLDTRGKASQAVQEQLSQAAPLRRLRLGQRVVHKQFGWRGMVCGWDPYCCESSEWAVTSKAELLKNGLRQTFYHVLVDAGDWKYDANNPPVAYVAEERLTCPEVEGKGTWRTEFGDDAFEHPYAYCLFLGADGSGDYVPCRQLRNKYNIQRRDVYAPGEEDSS